jgi:Transposase and inactivated derivatives
VARSRRKFSPHFKAEAVQFVIETGRPVAEVARELEINEGTLGNWVNQWKADNPEPEKAFESPGACPRG